MLSAAKEETFSAFGPWCAETCISASECEGEKPHQGVASKNPALHQGITWSNSTTALGLRGARLETRVRSRCTGKERDSESGLDKFGARYYGSSLGRFMTPDWATKPISVPYAEFGDPQTLNLYGYVRNNPLSKADADGHCYPWCTVAVGAVAGFVIGGGGEIIAAKLHGQSVDWKKVEGSAVKGAVTGAAIGLAGPEAGVAATAALGAGGNVLGGVADRTIQGQSAKEVLSPTEVAKDAASGAATVADHERRSRQPFQPTLAQRIAPRQQQQVAIRLPPTSTRITHLQ